MNLLNLRSTHFSVRFPKPKNRKQLTDPSLIKALDLDVELIKIDMYQKFEHRRPWFIKVRYILQNKILPMNAQNF